MGNNFKIKDISFWKIIILWGISIACIFFNAWILYAGYNLISPAFNSWYNLPDIPYLVWLASLTFLTLIGRTPSTVVSDQEITFLEAVTVILVGCFNRLLSLTVVAIISIAFFTPEIEY